MKKQYLVCVDASNSKLREEEIYLCKECDLKDGTYDVWDKANKFQGCLLKKRFAEPKNKPLLDTGISQLQEKLQKYESLKSQLKELKTEINSIYSRVGEQLKLEL